MSLDISRCLIYLTHARLLFSAGHVGAMVPAVVVLPVVILVGVIVAVIWYRQR